MTAVIILLALILLCSFKTVRIFIGIFLLLMWWNWPSHSQTLPALTPEAHATAWQCGRNYIIDAARYGLIYYNQTGPYHAPGGDVDLAETRAPGAPDDTPIQKDYRHKHGTLYYRGKPCAKAPDHD